MNKLLPLKDRVTSMINYYTHILINLPIDQIGNSLDIHSRGNLKAYQDILEDIEALEVKK